MTTPSVTHRFIDSSGHRLHLAESEPVSGSGSGTGSGAGSGADPDGGGALVVMIHGFPESWYSWRHQLTALSEAGYRAVAMDVRGYGRSTRPAAIEAYAMTALVGDVIAVIDDAAVDHAIVIGHDWGAPIAWNTALLRPERVRAVAGLSVPYNPRGDVRPLDGFRAMMDEGELFYIDYFQEPGVAEAEAEANLERWLKGFYFTASAEADPTLPSMGVVPHGHQMIERLQLPTDGQMAWLSDDDFGYYLGEFQRSGLTGGFNRYRNITRDWMELAPWRGAPIRVPSLFIGGDRDGPTQLGRRAIERFDQTLPGLVRAEILEGCGHWTQQEKPAEVNEILLDFLAGLPG